MPMLTTSRLTSFAPSPSKLSQARKFVCKMLKMSSRCWTPIMRRPGSTIFFKFGSKSSLKTSNLSLILRRGVWRFEVYWMDSLKLASRWWQWYKRAVSSNNQTGNYEEACLLWRDSEGEEVCLTRNPCLISYSHLQASCTASCIVGHWKWWSRWRVYSSGGSVFSFNYHLFVRFRIFCQFVLSMNKSRFLVETDCLEALSLLALR
jgi:hypothetical protein